MGYIEEKLEKKKQKIGSWIRHAGAGLGTVLAVKYGVPDDITLPVIEGVAQTGVAIVGVGIYLVAQAASIQNLKKLLGKWW